MIIKNTDMRLAFIHVNFNQSDMTINCIKTILHCCNDPKIVIVDNNSDESQKKILINWKKNNQNILQHVTFAFEKNNLGYFRALNEGLKKLNNQISHYDFVIIGNNDLEFREDFFKILTTTTPDENVYVISPDIIKMNGIHQNPYSIKGTTKKRKLLYHILYSNYYVAKTIFYITNLLNLGKSEKNRSEFEKSQLIFAGHGACYILTKNYFKHNFLLDDSSFLMGEEFIFAKQIRDTGGRILYMSDLHVIHNEHSSMSKLPTKEVYKYSKDAFKLFKNIC